MRQDIPANDDNRMLSVVEAAVYMGRTKGWLDKARCTGTGPPFHRIGRRILYSHTDLAEWLEARRFASTSEYGTRAACNSNCTL